MAERNNSNKIITILLAIVICVAAITILYVNLPPEGTEDEQIEDQDNNEDTADGNETEEPVVLLTVIYNETQNEYTLEDIEGFSSTKGTARQIKTKTLPDTVIINPELNESAWEFIGAEVPTILAEFDDLPENYNVTITGIDDYPIEYTKDNILGNVDVYNETGEVVATNGTTMILAYKQNGEYITEEYGPLRIAFVGTDAITGSNLWAKYVATIEIVEV